MIVSIVAMRDAFAHSFQLSRALFGWEIFASWYRSAARKTPNCPCNLRVPCAIILIF
jgi:hypothetical protein